MKKLPRKRRKPSRKLIVAAVIEEHFLTPEMFFSNTRWAKVVIARRDAIKRLHVDGAYNQEIADLIGRNVSVVNYHLDYENQKRYRATYYNNRWQTLRSRPAEYRQYLEKQRGRWKGKIAKIAGFEAIRNAKIRERA